jgi:hypothetical protein
LRNRDGCIQQSAASGACCTISPRSLGIRPVIWTRRALTPSSRASNMKLVCSTRPKHLFQVTSTIGVELWLRKGGWHLLRTISVISLLILDANIYLLTVIILTALIWLPRLLTTSRHPSLTGSTPQLPLCPHTRRHGEVSLTRLEQRMRMSTSETDTTTTTTSITATSSLSLRLLPSLTVPG